jgi:hypothetical protein
MEKIPGIPGHGCGTALRLAVALVNREPARSLAVIEALLDRSADVNEVRKDGSNRLWKRKCYSLLDDAKFWGRQDAIELLERRGARTWKSLQRSGIIVFEYEAAVIKFD